MSQKPQPCSPWMAASPSSSWRCRDELPRRVASGRLNVGYWTGPDADALSTEAGRELEFLRANEAFKAFRAWAPANGVHEVVFSAAAGRPGGAGRILDVTWMRGESGDWEKGAPRLREMTLPSFPALSLPIVRDSDEETVIAFIVGLVYGSVLDAKQYDQAVKLMRPDMASSSRSRTSPAPWKLWKDSTARSRSGNP